MKVIVEAREGFYERRKILWWGVAFVLSVRKDQGIFTIFILRQDSTFARVATKSLGK